MTFFIKGFTLGFWIAAIVGPISILCLRRAISHSPLLGFISGLGAATADAFYGAVAAFGLTALSGLLVEHSGWLRLFGGAFLIWLGIKSCLAKPQPRSSAEAPLSLLAGYSSTFLLTLANTMTIIPFTAYFASAGIVGPEQDFVGAGLMVSGVFLGSVAWWIILTTLAAKLRERLTLRHLQWVNRLSGAIIIGFGLWQIARLPWALGVHRVLQSN